MPADFGFEHAVADRKQAKVTAVRLPDQQFLRMLRQVGEVLSPERTAPKGRVVIDGEVIPRIGEIRG